MLSGRYEACADEIVELNKQVADLVGALEKYSVHLMSCKQTYPENLHKPCSCGFDEMKELHRRQGK